MRGIGFRLHMRPVARVVRTVVLVVCMLLAGSWAWFAGPELWFRVASAVVALACVAGLRILWGPVVVVRPEGLRIQRNWPLRRDIPWYRILAIDVIPGFWNLEIELNSGQRLALPAVDDLDRLYRLMEQHRQALDA
ncbi:MAG: PH domain-containing protein [Acidimicrobiales bacterium]|nr:PH domain-containing protein [Acidimicrobiales bacterium]